MADAVAKIDSNSRQTLTGVTDNVAAEIRRLLVDPTTGRLKVSATGIGGGDVTGPGSSTDNAVARFDGATGKIIQNSSVILDDSNHLRFGGADGTAVVDIAGATDVIQGVRIEGNTAAALSFSTYVTGDSFLRFTFLANGSMTWGAGTGVPDVSLSRSAVGTLAVSGALTVATNVSIGTASTLDGKLKLFNSSSGAEYDIFNFDDPNIPYDSLWLQRVYSQSTIGDPSATLVVVRAPENSAVISSIDTGTDVITTSAPHLFNTGMGVILQNSGGALPSPLITGTFYAVRNLSATTLALFPTVADANANTNRINLTTSGTGTNTIYLSTQEATTTYQRMRGTINEFMDVYANGYEDSMEFGIRLQKRGTGAVLRPFVISNYDGSSRNTLAYFDNINNRIGLGGNVAPTVAVDITGALRTSGSITADSAGTATVGIDRGAITNFGLNVFRTAGTDEWIMGLVNNSTNNFIIQDAINGASMITATQGATVSVTADGQWTFTTPPIGVGSSPRRNLSCLLTLAALVNDGDTAATQITPFNGLSLSVAGNGLSSSVALNVVATWQSTFYDLNPELNFSMRYQAGDSTGEGRTFAGDTADVIAPVQTTVAKGMFIMSDTVSGVLTWFAVNATGAANTNTTITGFTQDVDVRIKKTSTTNIKFYVNGALKATHTTNLPTGATASTNWFRAGVKNDAGDSTTRTLRFGYLDALVDSINT